MNIVIVSIGQIPHAAYALVRNQEEDPIHLTLVSVVEPSTVVDMTLSFVGKTRSRDILSDRIFSAESSLEQDYQSVRELVNSPMDVQYRAVVGDFADVAISAANAGNADLLVICDCPYRSIRAAKLVTKAPCAVAFLKPAA